MIGIFQKGLLELFFVINESLISEMFLCLFDSSFFTEGSKGQDAVGKRKAPVPLTDSPEPKRTKRFYIKGIICNFGFYYALS